MADLAVLVKKRATLKSKLTTFDKFLKRTPNAEISDKFFSELEKRIQNFTTILSEYEEIQGEIDILNEDENEDQEEEREEFEIRYYSLLVEAEECISKRNNSTTAVVDQNQEQTTQILVGVTNNNSMSASTNTTRSLTAGVRLPQIKLPQFCGKYENWLEYRDTFESLIHNSSEIGDIEKFHYLRASLTENAAQIINAIEFSAANYHIAWDLLCGRYNNKRLLVHNHLKSIFNLNNHSKESASNIRTLIDDISKHTRSLMTLQQPVQHWDTVIIHIIAAKLDPKTAREWEEYKTSGEFPTLEEFKSFLKCKAELLETLQLNHPSRPRDEKRVTLLTTRDKCQLCEDNHPLYFCSKFLNMSVNARIDIVKKHKLCYNCLKTGHSSTKCNSGSCKKCWQQHNTLLHFDKGDQNRKKTDTTTNCSSSSITSDVLLSTVVVQVADSRGKIHRCRALLDSGSQTNFMSVELANKLGLCVTQVKIAVKGINQSLSNIDRQCETIISSCNGTFKTRVACLIIRQICDAIPRKSLQIENLEIPKHLPLADPNFNKPGKIDLLLGTELFWKALCVGQVQVPNSRLLLNKTVYGWIVTGDTNYSANVEEISCNLATETSVQQQLQKFWELETFEVQKHRTKEEADCEQYFKNTTTRDENGRFIVTIPFKDSVEKLGESYNTAINRFNSLERRLDRNKALKEAYVSFMQEYEQLGHMQKVDDSKQVQHYYMPHHCVQNVESETTKLRVVFDGSAKTENGVSINDLQMVGPVIQEDLFSILMRFRQHNIAVSADISKMYRQVLVQEYQRPLQRILWRNQAMDEIGTYELKTVTYGTASASYLAVRCLLQIAIENEVTAPEPSTRIKRDFYVDDLLTGFDNVEDAIDISKQVKSMLERYGFHLRKWKSNARELSEAMESTKSDDGQAITPLATGGTTKTLGLFWTHYDDILSYKIKLQDSCKASKRIILSAIGQIFDPLGLLSPVIITAKIILQKLWEAKVSWDESVPQALHTEWLKFKCSLADVENIKIPRKVLGEGQETIQIHGFADASERAYGCCIYLKHGTNRVTVRLLCAKSKVAPIKSTTIPRLELCAALMLARMVKKVMNSLTINIADIFMWTDSSIVIAWLNSSSRMLKTFVANRVAEIQTITSTDHWRHVSSKENPADLLTRGLSGGELRTSRLWWSGPSWLEQNEDNWPVQQNLKPVEEIPELKSKELVTLVTHTSLPMFDNISSLKTLRRVMAYVLRFVHNLRRNAEQREKGNLNSEELHNAMIKLIELSQAESFENDLAVLQGKKGTRSNIQNLNPFLDDNKILRVGGRLDNSKYSYDKKHPVLLHSKHQLTKLIMEEEHQRLLHAGPQLLLASTRERYWPIGGRNLAKQIVRKCIKCFRVTPRAINPLMGQLPEVRTMQSFPFEVVGIDYGGPFTIKNRMGRGAKTSKGYLCLFVCFTTKALHLELATDLSTSAFILALKRFMARRGRPRMIYSDNGSNFKGAYNELRNFKDFLKNNDENLQREMANEGIKWKFSPAYSPHFGGIWEAGIKSVKAHLKRVVGNTILTYEQMYTVFTQIEAILNSRPLSPLSEDPHDYNPLTPSHFLIGRTLSSIPETDLTNEKESRLTIYKRIEQIRQHFWRRWSKEYIGELQQRVKWKKQHASLITVGKLVLLKDENLPPLRWQLGRIMEIHPGADNVIRVVSVKLCGNTVVKRGVSKICVLPVD